MLLENKIRGLIQLPKCVCNHVHTHRAFVKAAEFTRRKLRAAAVRTAAAPGPAPAWSRAKPAESRDSPFYDLELNEIWDGVGKTRVRQHVNPLRSEFQKPSAPPDWSAVFDDPSLPLAVDIGSGYGRFLLLLQRNNPDRRINYLGLEIRRTLVDRSNAWSERLGLRGRVAYVFANATVSLATLLAAYSAPVTDVFIQFPDPHFKRRHHKRRVVQRSLVEAVASCMAPGGRLLLQSDVEPVTVAMRNMFEKYGSGSFTLAPEHQQGPVFFSNRPMGHSGTDGSVDRPSDASSSSSTTAAEVTSYVAATAQEGGQLVAATATPGQCTACDDQPTGAPVSSITSSRISSPSLRLASSNSSSQVDAEGPVRLDLEHDNTTSRDGGGFASAVRHDSEYGSSGGEETEDGTAPDDSSDDQDDDVFIESMESRWAAGGWLAANPLGTPTEREHYVLQQGLPVYRVLLART